MINLSGFQIFIEIFIKIIIHVCISNENFEINLDSFSIVL